MLKTNNADDASLSSSDATKSYFNIDYEPLYKLKEAMSTACGKNIADLPTPVTKQFVSMDDKSVEELDVKSILDLEIPPGKNVRTQKAMSSS